ncbi:MAG: GNAT family N-acetyltransferase [Gammaproteobacteria bacterium]|nr:GNAT family N-acetyltransferase [Gammaproteobacteria bacterium]
MTKEDLCPASIVHEQAFPRQRLSQQWLDCSLKSYPCTLCFVVTINENVVGYIIWVQKSGFRPEVVLELYQIAVLPNFQDQGIGHKLIMESLPEVRHLLSEQKSKLKHIIVTTRADNFAQKLYKQTLGAEVEATISNLYSADEVIMVARNVQIET